MTIETTINGVARRIESTPDTPLLWVLRDELGLSGTKFGCGRALCGACTVHVDDQPVRACAYPVRFAAGKRVRTIESIEESTVGKAVVEAWVEEEVVQCGWCQPGQCMSAAALLSEIPAPTDDDIDAAMSGNLCRCGTYVRIRKAIHAAAKGLEGNEGGEGR
ncbi:MAG: (2Fe-2S)-binding protein [Planctomycetota bacterium]